jgi:arylformamidase
MATHNDGVEYIDVTVPVRSGMPVYEGDPAVELQRVTSMTEGGICNISRLDFGLHSGTHIDAPLHFIDGAGGVESIPLDALIGEAFVADATPVMGNIDLAALRSIQIPSGSQRILFKTTNSRLWDQEGFSRDFVALTEDAARELVRRGVRLVGIDYLSIAPFSDAAPTHIALLEAGVVILEGLDLRSVTPGMYRLLCLPLLVPGADGAPARTLLQRL